MPQDNRSAMRKTIVARIATFDTSIKNPTPEQVAETIRLLDLAIEVFNGQPDGEVLKKMKAELEKSNKDINSPVTQYATQAPSGNISPETEVPEANVPEQEETQSAMGGGDVVENAGRWVDMHPAPASTPAELTRINGTAKGEGFFGRVPYAASPGSYMTEQSIDEGTALKPLLVPTLTPDEVVGISQGKRPSADTYRKVDAFAAERKAAGKSVWAAPGEQKPLHPGLINMMNAKEKQSAMGGGDVAPGLNVSEARFTPTGPRVDSDEEAIGYTIAMLKENEGFKSKAYWDKTGKVWTVGHGLTEYPDGRKVGPRDVVTEEQSAQHMRDYVTKKLIPVAAKNVPNWATMDPRLKAAMLDTGYNAGPGYFGSKSPRMLKRLGSGEDPAKVLAEENATWNKSGGVVVKGLENRRQRVKERLIDWYSRDNSKSV